MFCEVHRSADSATQMLF